MRIRHLPLYRIVILTVTLVTLCILTGWLVAREHYGYLSVIIIAIIFTAWHLIDIYRNFIKKLSFVFNAVRNNDFTFRFIDNPRHSGNSIINYSLNRIKDVLEETKAKIEDKERYYEAIIECANIGIIIIMENGTVVKTNSKALQMLGIPLLSHIDRLSTISKTLVEALHTISSREQKSVCYQSEVGKINLMLNCSNLEHEGKNLRIVSIENISHQLDTQEGLAWEKFTRVLTHEIMNSLAPVTSISNTLLNNDNNDEKILRQGLETIHSTSDRLLQFVNSFRTVTRIPPPTKHPFELIDLFNEAASVIDFSTINFNICVSPQDTMLYADRTQLSQVLVNLLKNAVEACRQKGGENSIELRSHIADDERIYIEVSNTGNMIPAEVVENIFTPFFTTKNDGSGIGLAVAKQIIRLHGGTLDLACNSEEKVTFLIILD